jgi:hypothetical protein
MRKEKLVTGILVSKQQVKAQMILENHVIPRAELYEIRKASGKLSNKLKLAIKKNA